MGKRAGAHGRSANEPCGASHPLTQYYCRDSRWLDGTCIRDIAAENAKSEEAKHGEDPEHHMPQTRPVVGAS